MALIDSYKKTYSRAEFEKLDLKAFYVTNFDFSHVAELDFDCVIVEKSIEKIEKWRDKIGLLFSLIKKNDNGNPVMCMWLFSTGTVMRKFSNEIIKDSHAMEKFRASLKFAR